MSANLIEVSNVIAKSMTSFFLQKSPLYNTSNHDYTEQFSQQSYATGGSINIKVPAYPSVQRGLSVTPDGIDDLVIPYTITEEDFYNVVRPMNAFQNIFQILGGDKRALTATDKKAIVDNYGYPAYQAITAEHEKEAAFRLKTTAYLSPIDEVGKLGPLNTYSSISQIETLMGELKLPTERYLIMNYQDAQLVADSLQNMFNPMINKNITLNARIGGPDKGRLAGLDLYRSTELSIHTAGPLAAVSGIEVDSVASNGSTITFKNVTATTGKLVNAGDRISIPSVRLLSNVNGNELSTKLVVTAATDADGDGAGKVTVTLSFPLLPSSEHKNVNSLPAVDAPAFFFPDYRENYAYVPAGLSCTPLRIGDIYGAINSNVKGQDALPVKVTMQGTILDATNLFRIWMLVGIRAFAPYVISIPSSV